LVEIKNKALPSYLIDMENLITDEDLELVVYKKCHWRDDKNEEPKAFASGLFITSLQQLMTHFENHPKQNRGLFSQYQNYLLAESVAQMLEP
jgi:hypothetical protein